MLTTIRPATCHRSRTFSTLLSNASHPSKKIYVPLLHSQLVSEYLKALILVSHDIAIGNIAVGNLHHFLPVIVKMVERDPAKRLLSLHALKEVVTHCSHGQLENVADMLWTPLFQNSEESEEITRNVAAACLGKLATTAPQRYLPQLHVSAILRQTCLLYLCCDLGTYQRRQPGCKSYCHLCNSLHIRGAVAGV